MVILTEGVLHLRVYTHAMQPHNILNCRRRPCTLTESAIRLEGFPSPAALHQKPACYPNRAFPFFTRESTIRLLDEVTTQCTCTHNQSMSPHSNQASFEKNLGKWCHRAMQVMFDANINNKSLLSTEESEVDLRTFTLVCSLCCRLSSKKQVRLCVPSPGAFVK